MKNFKKFLLTMAMTMALGTSAFAASGFEFLLQVPLGMHISFPNKETKDLGVKAWGGFDAGVDAQIGYMFQVKDRFGISLLAELGYIWDWYNYGERATATSVGGWILDGSYHSFKLGLLPKFNIGFGGRHGLAIGIGGGVKIPIAATLSYGLSYWDQTLYGGSGGAAGIEEGVNLKRQDITDMFSPSVIGYMKVTFDYYLFFTDNIGMNFGLYLGGSFGPKTKLSKIGGNAFDFGLQIGFRFGPKA